MPATPSDARHRAMALVLVLFTLGVAYALVMQLFAITRAQQQTLPSYGFAARRAFTNQAHSINLRRDATRGSGRIGHGSQLRRYRCFNAQGQHLQVDTVQLRVNAELSKFIYTSLHIQHPELETLKVHHVGGLP